MLTKRCQVCPEQQSQRGRRVCPEPAVLLRQVPSGPIGPYGRRQDERPGRRVDLPAPRAAGQAGLIPLAVALLLTVGTAMAAEQFDAEGHFILDPDSPLGRREHPRLHLTQENLPRLRNIILTHYKSEYQRYVDQVGRTPVDNSRDNTLDSTAAGHHPWQAVMIHQAFIGLLNIPESEIQYTIKPGDFSRLAVNRLLERLRAGDRLANPAVLVYDWTYHAMTPEERHEIALLMRDRRIFNSQRVPPDYSLANPVFTPVVLYSSDYYDEMYAFYVGLALWGDDPDVNAAADNAVSQFSNTMLNYGYLDGQNFVAGDEGGVSEGFGYGGWHPRAHYMYVDGWRTATGENYISQSGIVQGNAMKNYPYSVLYALDPYPYFGTEHTFLVIGDMAVGANSVTNDPLMEQLHLLGGLLLESGFEKEAGLARYLVDRYKSWGFSGLEGSLLGFLGAVRTVQPVDPEQVLPKARWFKNLGGFYARTGFSDPTDSVFVVSDGHFNFAGHKGLEDYPGFTLARFGQLVNIRECCSKSRGNLSDYLGGSEDNVVEFEGGHTRLYNSLLTGIRNVKSPEDLRNAVNGIGNYDLGGIEQVTQREGEFYHVRVDRSRLFVPGVSHTREYVWIPGKNRSSDSDFLVVYDRTVAPSKPQWIYHVPWKPTVSNYAESDDLTLNTGDPMSSRIGTGYNGNSLLVTEKLNSPGGEQRGNNDGNLASDAGAHGVVFVTTLLPEQARVEVTRVSTFNRNVISYQGSLALKTSRWQVAVMPRQEATEQRFLHVFETADANLKTSMANTTLIQNSQVEGVFVERQSADHPNASVIFAKNKGVVSDPISYAIHGQGRVLHIVTGLKPRTQYLIEDNSPAGTVTQSKSTETHVELWNYRGVDVNTETGVLYFESRLEDLESTHQIRMVPEPSGAPMRGDVNQDGMVNLRDAIQLLRWIAGQPGRPESGTDRFLTADVNRDGRLTLADFICLLRGIMAGGTLPC